MNRQEILEALKNDNYYRNLSDKNFFDANNLDNLAKYLEHNFAKTDESKKVILDMLSHKKHNPSDLYDYRITQEELFNLNKKYYDNTYLYHGLNAYTTNLTDKSLDISEKIENNLHNITNNKDIELATSSTHMIGDIGIKGKGDSLFAQPWDMYSVVDKETGQRSKPRAGAVITEDDIFGVIEKYHKNPKKIKPWEKHDEVIAKNFEIESLWVKEDFYNNNQDFVLKLLKDNKIQNLDIVHSNSFEQYRDVDIERINVNNINLKNNKAITNKNIRQELLELVSQTGSHAVNEADSKIASFLNGEISLSQEELETIKNEFTDKWFNTAPSKRKLKEYESYSLKEYFDLPDDEYDDYIAEKLMDKVSNRKDLTETFDITKDEQLHFDKQWKKDDVFKFSNGTSETRARLFLSEGKGYTSLQTPAFIEGETYLSRTGLQISMQGTDFESRSPEYAKAQSSRFKDRPVIIEGEIPAQYVYANQSRGGEFGIPHQYYDKISSAKILDAETRQELYHLENGKLVKSDSFIEAKLPELKIKKENNIKPKLISQEAFDKYGPNDDKFYTSQGLDPKKQKEAINKLNSKRKPQEPLPDYSADDARLDKIFAEDKAYIESLEKQRKRPNYKPVKCPKLKEKTSELDNIIDEYRQILLDKYKRYADITQTQAAAYGGDNLFNKDFITIINNHGGIYGENARYDMHLSISDREKEILDYLNKQGLTKHTETIHQESGNTYQVIIDNTNKFINENIVNDDFRNQLNEYTSSEDFNNIYKDNTTIDDSLDNLKNESVKKKKYKPVKESELKETVKQDKNLEKATNEVFDNFTENINNTPKPEVKNTPKPSKNIVKPAKNTSKMTTKSLGGVGKGAIGLIVAGVTGLVVGKALSSDNDNKDKKQDKQVAKQQNISYNNQYIDNKYAMQMAQDISSYRYGKHMTGFVNF